VSRCERSHLFQFWVWAKNIRLVLGREATLLFQRKLEKQSTLALQEKGASLQQTQGWLVEGVRIGGNAGIFLLSPDKFQSCDSLHIFGRIATIGSL
jgi:hypothetical protein